MRYEFTKMQSLGNDFVVLDGVTRALHLDASIARRLADRRLGVGCDQVLVAQPPGDADADFRFRIFNQDGSEVGQCGNGARCLARFLRDAGLTDKTTIRVQTQTRLLELRVAADNSICVDMGAPDFTPAHIPFQAARAADCYALTLGEARDTPVEIAALSLGNPHAVLRVDAVDSADVAGRGARIAAHARFPAQANVGFMQVVARNEIRLRVYERGVGETQGCGSGACAAVVAGIRRGWLDSKVRVQLPGGRVEVEWRGDAQSVLLMGGAVAVFAGVVELG